MEYYFYFINYDEDESFEKMISKKEFDDFVERSKMNTYSKTFILKWIVVTFYDDHWYKTVIIL